MRLYLYSIHDKLMNVYLAPFVARADVEAVRQISASLDDPQMAKSALNQTPSDYDLCIVGEFNDETGCLNEDDDIALQCYPRIVKAISEIRTVRT